MSGPRLSIIPAGAVIDARLEGRDLQVLALLGSYTDRKGWCCRSQVAMSRQIGCARSTLQTSLSRLLDAGWIEWRALVKTNGGDRAHEYRVVLDDERAISGSGAAPIPADDGARDEDEPEDDVAPPVPTGRQGAPALGRQGVPLHGSAPLRTTLPERKMRESGQGRDEDDDRDVEAKLAAFRPIWPTTRSDDAGAVEAAMRALPAEDRAAALAGVPAFLAALKADGRKLTIGGATYLSRRRWEPAVAARAAAVVGGGAASSADYAPAWSKRWWAAMILAVEAGQSKFENRKRVSMASRYNIGCTIDPKETARVDARAEALTPAMTDGARARAWAAWFCGRGVDFDEKFAGKPFAVFLPPGDPPPEGPGLGLDDEDIGGFDGGGR